MKQYKLYIALLAGLLLAGCSKEDPAPAPVPGGGEALAVVSIAVDGVAGTKATRSKAANDTEDPAETPTTEVGSEKENAINNVAVLFIDTVKNEVAGYGYKDFLNEKENTDGDKAVRVGLKTGEYKMLVIANMEDLASFNPTDYYNKITTLEKQGAEKGFVMSNITHSQSIKVEKNEAGEITKNENSITEKVKRVVARVELSNLAVDWRDDDLKAIDGLEFRLSKVALANVRPQSYLFDMIGWNFDAGIEKHPMEIRDGGYLCGIKKYKEGGEIVAGNTYVEYLKENISDVTIGNGESHENIAQFYAMTNSDKSEDTAPVILYLKGTLYDTKNNKPVLADRYYRIRLVKGVQRNTTYKISATVQGKGSFDPGDIQENVDLSVTITVKTWDNVTLDQYNINEEIEM